MKKINKLFSLLIVITSLLILVSCDITEEPPVDEIVITLNKTNVSLQVGETFKFEATVKNSEEQVEWSSLDDSVVTISNDGLATAIAKGETKIEAKIDNVKKEAIVTVTLDEKGEFPVILVSHEKVEILEGSEPFKVTAEVIFEGETLDAQIEWESLDENIVTVLDGLITPVNVGKTEIIVRTTIDGEILETIIDVEVKIDAAIMVDKSEVILNLTTSGEVGMTFDIIETELYIEDELILNEDLLFEVFDETIVLVTMENNVFTIKALEIGETFLEIFYFINDYKVTANINIKVEQLTIDLGRIFPLDLLDESTATLDLELYDWKDDVIEIKRGNAVISTLDNPYTISKNWIKTQTLGSIHNINIITNEVIYEAKLEIVQGHQDVGLNIAEGGGGAYVIPYTDDVTEFGFEEDDSVYEFYRGSVDSWEGRAALSNSAQGYDYLVFDFYTDDEAFEDGYFVIWLGLNHSFLLERGGQITVLESGGVLGGPNYKGGTDYVKIFDTNMEPISSPMVKGEKYSIHIDLKHRANDISDYISFNKELTMYIGNLMLATKERYEEIYGPIEDIEINENFMPLNFKTTSDADGDTFLLEPNLGPNIYEYKIINPSAWTNRIQVSDNRVQNYDYIVFDLMLTEELANRMVLWMDMAVGKTIVYDPSIGVADSNRLTVYSPDGVEHKSKLTPQVIYTFVVELIHEDPEIRYALGFDQATTMYLRDAYAVKESYLSEFIPEYDESSALDNKKELAIEEINNVFNNYNESFYSNENWTLLNTIKDDAIEDITSLETEEEVINKLEETLLEMASVETELDSIKLVAINNLNELLSTLDEEDYEAENWQLIETIIFDAIEEINLKDNLEEISNIELKTVNDVNDVLTILDSYKITAKEVILEDFEQYNKNDYTTNDWNNMLFIISQVDDYLEVQKSIEEVDQVVLLAKTEFAKVTPKIKEINFELTNEIDEGTKYTVYDEESKTYMYKTETSEGWNNRLKAPQIYEKYDYLMFEMLLEEDQTFDIVFWMDAPTTYNALEGGLTSDKVKVYNENGSLVSGTLVKNTIYIVVIEIVLDGSEVRSFAPFKDTTLFIRNPLLVKESVKDLLPEQEQEFKFSFSKGDDNEAFVDLINNEDGTTLYKAKAEDAWDNRVEINNAQISEFDYIVFELTFLEELTSGMTFWMNMSNVTQFEIDTSNNTGRVRVLDENGNQVKTNLLKDVKYTFVISLLHGEGEYRYDFGVNQPLEMLISNPRAITQKQHDLEFPMKVEFSKSADGNYGIDLNLSLYEGDVTELGFNENDQVYKYETLVAGEWTNRVEYQGAVVTNYEYMEFNILFTEELSENPRLRVDMLNSFTFDFNNINDNPRLKVYNQDGELVEGKLEVNQVYHFEVELMHDDLEYRYSLGFSELTTVYLANLTFLNK